MNVSVILVLLVVFLSDSIIAVSFRRLLSSLFRRNARILPSDGGLRLGQRRRVTDIPADVLREQVFTNLEVRDLVQMLIASDFRTSHETVVAIHQIFQRMSPIAFAQVLAKYWDQLYNNLPRSLVLEVLGRMENPFELLPYHRQVDDYLSMLRVVQFRLENIYGRQVERPPSMPLNLEMRYTIPGRLLVDLWNFFVELIDFLNMLHSSEQYSLQEISDNFEPHLRIFRYHVLIEINRLNRNNLPEQRQLFTNFTAWCDSLLSTPDSPESRTRLISQLLYFAMEMSKFFRRCTCRIVWNLNHPGASDISETEPETFQFPPCPIL